MRIVVDPPGFDLGARILDRKELRDVQALVAQPAVERLYVPVLSRLSRMDEVELYPALIRPLLERLRGELGAVIHRDGYRGAGACDGSVKGRDHVAAQNENLGSSNGV